MEHFNQEFIQEFFEISNDLFAITDLNWRFTDINSAWTQKLGWSKQEILSMQFIDFVHPEDRVATLNISQKLINGAKPIDFENRCRHKEGGYRWFSWTGAVSKKHKCGFGIAKDITNYKQTTNDHVESLKKLQLVTDNIKDTIWMTDPSKNKMIFISKGYERIWEQSCESLLESPLSFIEAIHPSDRDRIIQAFSKQTKGQYNETYRINTPSGEKWILDRAFPVKDEQGAPYLVVGIASDITEQRLTQKLLEEERAKTIQSSKLATLGEMAGGVAHEINNPLAAISAKFQQLRKIVDGDELIKGTDFKSSLALVERNINRIEKIVKSLRLFSRDGSEDPFECVSIKHVLEETLELCSEKMQHHSVELRLRNISEIYIEGRAVQLSQVLLNLLNNAFDAVFDVQERWIEIRIQTKDDQVEISVMDSGTGIAQDIAEKIMEPFFTTKDVGRGTGLGLSISRGIIEAHHGELLLDQSSKHTRFVIRLPKVSGQV